MDPTHMRLFEAARTGSVDYLLRLIRENTHLLDTVALAETKTPLHIASMLGHLPFVQEMLKLRKQFAYELNQDGFTPLHLASASGHLHVVVELLKIDHNLCGIQGREQRLPVHCSVVKGRTNVINQLLSASPTSVECKTARGETLLHLAVKNNQSAAFKLLVEHIIKFKKEQLLNEKDNQGNTVLHLAVSRKQYQVVGFLLVDDKATKVVVEVNSLNETGMTPLDVLLLFQSEAGDLEMYRAMVEAGAKRGKDMSTSNKPAMQSAAPNQPPPSKTSTGQSFLPARVRYWPRLEELAELFGYKTDRDSASDARSALLTVAILMATATYQAVLSPPGGLWQEDKEDPIKILQTAGKSIYGSKKPEAFFMFMIGNTIGFF